MKKSKLNTEDGMGLGYEMYDDIVEFIQEFKKTEVWKSENGYVQFFNDINDHFLYMTLRKQDP